MRNGLKHEHEITRVDNCNYLQALFLRFCESESRLHPWPVGRFKQGTKPDEGSHIENTIDFPQSNCKVPVTITDSHILVTLPDPEYR